MRRKLIIFFLLSLTLSLNTIFAQVVRDISIEWKWKINIGPNTSNPNEPIWYNQPACAIYEDGILYVSYGKEFIVIDNSDGKILYKLKPASKKVFYKFTMDTNYIYIIECPREYNKMSENGGSLLKLDKKTGKEIWKINDSIIPFVNIYSLDNELMLIYKRVGVATYIAKNTGEESEHVFMGEGKIKGGTLINVYPVLFKGRYIFLVISINSMEIAELNIFDVLTKEKRSILFNSGLPEGADLEILLVDDENVIIKGFDTRYHPPQGNNGKVLCINWEKNVKIWEYHYNVDEEIKSVFATAENSKVYYTISFSGYLSLIDRVTGIKLKEITISSNLDIANISQPATWQNYALIRDANNLLMLDLEGRNVTLRFREHPLEQKSSYWSIININLITPLSPLIFQSKNTSEVIVVLLLSENIYNLKVRNWKNTKLTINIYQGDFILHPVMMD